MIYNITPKILSNPNILKLIYENNELHYYWSDEFSESFYIDLALAGFINTSTKQDGDEFLLCEIQKSYAILDFKDLHVSKSVNKLLKQKRYTFKINSSFNEVLDAIQISFEDCWMRGKYAQLIQKLYKNPSKKFMLVSCELLDSKNEKLVAGEIGYFTLNNVYTSLSGFSVKQKPYNNVGKLQMVLLAKYLKSKNISFWNLGHPYMQYKLDLGAKVLQRDEFLNRWYGI
jgi:Leu/Phe-tRNA-protein transferase